MIYVEILETEETKDDTTVNDLTIENPIRQVRYTSIHSVILDLIKIKVRFDLFHCCLARDR